MRQIHTTIIIIGIKIKRNIGNVITIFWEVKSKYLTGSLFITAVIADRDNLYKQRWLLLLLQLTHYPTKGSGRSLNLLKVSSKPPCKAVTSEETES